MRKFRAVLAALCLALLAIGQAYAAVSRTNLEHTPTHITSGSIPAFTATVNVGDLIVVEGLWGNSGVTYGFSDNVNSGTYTAAPGYPVTYANGFVYGVYYKVATAAGVPTITPLGYGASGVFGVAQSYTGFSGSPTVVSGDSASSSGTGTAVSSGSFNTSAAEVVAVGAISSNTSLSTGNLGGIWGNSVEGSYSQLVVWDSIGADPGGIAQSTAVSITGTLAASNSWGAAVVAFSTLRHKSGMFF